MTAEFPRNERALDWQGRRIDALKGADARTIHDDVHKNQRNAVHHTDPIRRPIQKNIPHNVINDMISHGSGGFISGIHPNANSAPAAV